MFFVLFSFESVYADTPPPPPEFNEVDVPIGGLVDNNSLDLSEVITSFGQINHSVDLSSSNEISSKNTEGEHSSAVSSLNIHLKIEKGDTILYDNLNMTVTSCGDISGSGEVLITARCAVLQSGLDVNWIYDGAYIDSINDITGYITQDSLGNDVYHYWSIYFNNNYAEVGLNEYILQPNDLVTLSFVDPVIEVDQGCGSCENSNIKTFDINKAINFLKSHQKTDGSFDEDLYTDWVAVAVGGTDDASMKTSIKNYLLNDDFSSSLVTDYERRAMALMSLGINPYSGTEVNYIKKIVDSFDGEQIGDSDIINDDIFGIIVLKNAGYDSSDEIISKTISFILSKQSASGAFENIDLTSASILVLDNFTDIAGVSSAISSAKNYLSQNQGSDGGFSNSFSTSWALQAMSSVGFSDSDISNAKSYLASKQQEDGGVDVSDYIDNRIWATAYAIPAISHKPWSEIMGNFSKVIDPIYPVRDDNKEKVVEEAKETEEVKVELSEPTVETMVVMKEIRNENLKEEKKIEEVNNDNLSANAIGAMGDKKLPRWVTQSIIGLVGISILGFMFRLKI